MISVHDAEKLVLSEAKDYGVEDVSIDGAPNRVLAEPVLADRDFPPGNRATMDGIAIKYQSFVKGQRKFNIKTIQPAGSKAVEIDKPDQCVQIMTGSILGKSVNTVVPIEDLVLQDTYAKILTDNITNRQFVHFKAADKKQGETIVTTGQTITPKILTILASAGRATVKVKKLPKIVILTTGDELVEVTQKPQDFQFRRSNDRMMQSVLNSFLINPDKLHLPDNKMIIKTAIGKSLKKYDVVLLSGGVSKGQFDYVQAVLEELGVNKLFHGVRQRPGKPFWFGHSNSALVFAFPGNPVSSFLCLHRYFVPWLVKSLGMKSRLPIYAVLSESIASNQFLTQFLPVGLSTDKSGQLLAYPLKYNGSGDFISLADADAFAEVPESLKGQKGIACRVWRI